MKTIRCCFFTIVIVVVIACVVYGSEDNVQGITKEQIEQLSDTQKNVLEITIDAAIAAKEDGNAGYIYSSILNVTLSDFSIDELKKIKIFLSDDQGNENNQNLVQIGNESTSKRNLTEFCELYMRRATVLQASGIDYNIYPRINGSVPQIIDSKDLIVTITSGIALVDLETFKIERLIMNFLDLDLTIVENDSYFANCAISISALEYDYLSELIYSLKPSTDKESESCIEECFRILSEQSVPLLNSETLVKMASSGNGELIYSGNYDYYMAYAESEESPELYYLIAVARE